MRRSLIWTPILVVGVLLLALARPVRVRTDGGASTAWLWAWQTGTVAFTNSVTGGPVRITFGLRTGFDRFHMATDEKTENYYTSGTYRINARLRPQRTRTQNYCSVVGMTVRLGRSHTTLRDSCLELTLLWPPF